MYARITIIEMPPERLSDFEELSRLRIGPSFVGVPGQRLGFYLIDRTRGRVMMVPVAPVRGRYRDGHARARVPPAAHLDWAGPRPSVVDAVGAVG